MGVVEQAGERTFGEYRIDAGAGQLFRGDQAIRLTPKSFALLAYFVERAGNLVTREELFARHWPGQVVTDDALTRCVREIRHALADDSHAPRWLTTVHKRGYRFVALAKNSSSAPAIATTDVVAKDSPIKPNLPIGDSFAADANEPFVGRQEQLVECLAFLDAGLHQQRGVLLEVSGEPGIGKSRFVFALSQQWQGSGKRLAFARAAEARGAPPFWLWIQLLRALVEANLPFQLDETTVVALREQLAELEQRRGAGGERAGFDRDHFATREGVVRLLLQVARAQPLLLVIEDLHGAEADCLLLLTELCGAVRNQNLGIVLTYRDVGAPRNEAFVSCLAELSRSAALRKQLALRGLGSEAVRALMQEGLGSDPGADLTRRALSKTGGNPLYLLELLALPGEDSKNLTPSSWALQTPETVRQLIARRLQLLDETTRSTLEVAAVMGLEFYFPVLLEEVGVDERQRNTAMLRAQSERLVIAMESDSARWRFSHGLVREILCEHIEPTRHMQLHWRVGLALEAELQLSRSVPFAALALHFASATPSPEQQHKTALYLWEAAQHALSAYAYREARGHFEQLLAHLERHQTQDLQRLSQVLAGCATSAGYCAQPERARSFAARAVEVARRAGDAITFAWATLALADLQPAYPHSPEVIALLSEALAGVADDTSRSMQSRLLAQRAYRYFLNGEMRSSRHDATIAVECARAARDDLALEGALTELAHTYVDPEEDEQRRLICEERFSIARRLQNSVIEYRAQFHRLAHVMEIGPGQSDIQLELRRFVALANSIDRPLTRAAALRAQAGAAILTGDIARAGEWAHAALTEGRTTTDAATSQAYWLLQFGTILQLQGRLHDLRGAVLDGSAMMQNSLMRVGAIYVRAIAGDRALSRELMDDLVRRDLDLQRDLTYAAALANLALSCVQMQHVECAAKLFPLLMPFRRRNLTAQCYFNAGCGSQYLGLLAAVMGHWQSSAEFFREAIEINSHMGSHIWHAESILCYLSVSEKLGAAEISRAESFRPALEAFLHRTGITQDNLTRLRN